MSETTGAMRRMLRPLRSAPAGAQMTEARAWRHAVPRSCETMLGLVAAVLDCTEGSCDHAGLLQGWDETSVIWRLEGPGTPGLAVLDASAAAALIEGQTMRRVARAPLSPRPATPVDAALCAPVVEAWLAARDAVLPPDEGGWRLGLPVTSARAAKFLLEEVDYATRSLRLSFADGMREGTLVLAVPVPRPVPDPACAPEDRSALLLPEADLTAVLHRARVPFRWLAEIAPGASFEIPRAALQAVRVESEDGLVIARARLGQVRGHRALKLVDDGDASGPGSEPGDLGALTMTSLPSL